MTVERCDFCELPVGAGCACGSSTSGSASAASSGEWSRFAAGTIMISSNRYAHRPGGCAYVEERYVVEPEWGWIPEPDPQVWIRIGESYRLYATEGNTARYAVKRCSEGDS